MTDYIKLMKKCLNLANKGSGNVSPNPMVGCVVLDKFGKIISTGYHHKYGCNHAERDALLKLKNGEEEGGTLVVNLEPCSHFGKTPPCVDLIIERKIAKVVIGAKDSNQRVSGNGIKKLKDSGIEVITNVLEEDSRELNRIFFTDVEESRIYVALKTATTMDGKIATITKDSKWITSEKSRKYSKSLRKRYDAILTTSKTVMDDNPEMKHKLKIIVDTNFKVDLKSKIFNDGKIILAVGKNIDINDFNFPDNINVLKCETKNNHIDVNDLFNKLYKLNVKSVFIEAGGVFSGEVIKNNLADEIYHFIAPKIINDNNALSCFNGDNVDKISTARKYRLLNVKRIDNDVLVVYRRLYNFY